MGRRLSLSFGISVCALWTLAGCEGAAPSPPAPAPETVASIATARTDLPSATVSVSADPVAVGQPVAGVPDTAGSGSSDADPAAARERGDADPELAKLADATRNVSVSRERILDIEPRALARIREIMKDFANGVALRVWAEAAPNCVGYKYEMNFELVQNIENVVLTHAEGLLVAIHVEDVEFIQGAKLDFVSQSDGREGFLFTHTGGANKDLLKEYRPFAEARKRRHDAARRRAPEVEPALAVARLSGEEAQAAFDDLAAWWFVNEPESDDRTGAEVGLVETYDFPGRSPLVAVYTGGDESLRRGTRVCAVDSST